MRGKLSPAVKYVAELGITPADAGKTVPAAAVPDRREDHPRGCGENDGLTFAELSEEGSPPRMRGKHFNDGKLYEFRGITPADAGKTRLRA